MSASGEKPVRKFPPPCWTRDEALALIQAYRERWHALGRGYLRTADWEVVADEVGRSCPDASPAKTSAQSRHKMEKLRQHYHAEKQQSLSFPGRFFSSWWYFEAMDAMENGSNTEVGKEHNDGGEFDKEHNDGGGEFEDGLLVEIPTSDIPVGLGPPLHPPPPQNQEPEDLGLNSNKGSSNWNTPIHL